MDTYRRFLKRFGFTGFMLSVLAVSFLAMLVLMVVLGDQKFATMWSLITLPADLETAVRQPWTLLTFWLGNDPRALWFLLMDLAVLYGFGHILNAMIGDRRMQAIVVMSILFVGLVTVGLCNLMPWVETTENTRLFGFGAINATIIAATITLVPRYNFRLLFWDIPLVFVGLFVMALSILSHRLFFTMEGTAELVGAGLGFGIIKILRSGWDLTNWFRGAANRPTQQVARQPEPVISTNRPIIRTVPKQQPQSQQQQQPFMSDAEELDYLLDKIGEVGYSGLSQAEKERLDKLAAK